MDFIKYMDFFYIKFSFYTNNQPYSQSVFGGIMTFIYIISCLLIFFISGYDDLVRLNPTTTLSEIPYTKRKLVNMTKENIYIPFRIVNYENKFIDHRGILYILPYLIEGKLDNEGKMDLKYTLLKYKFCNETSMVDRPDTYRIDIPLNQLFCFEKNDILFGGNWNHNFLNYIEINLYLCEDGAVFNSSDPKCSKIDNYLKSINSSLLFDFYFPIVQLQPKNLENPVQIIYKNYYYRLSTYNYKIQKLYIKEHILSDDNNIIKANYKNSSCWGMSNIYSDDYYLPSTYDPISDNSNSSRIYALNIYMDDGLVYHTRTFKKLFIILSDYFPMFKILLFLLKKFTQNIKMSFIKRDLIELVFENKNTILKNFPKSKLDYNFQLNPQNNNKFKMVDKSENEVIIKDKTLKNNEFKNLNINNNITIIKNNNYINKYEENKNNIDNNNQIIEINKLNEDDNKKIYKTNFPMLGLKESKTLFTEQTKNFKEYNKNKLMPKEKKKYLFPYYYYFFDIIFDNLTKPTKFFNFDKNYFIIYNFMCQIYDISSHIFLVKQFNILNNITIEKINEEKTAHLKRLSSKININDKKKIENLNNEYKSDKSIPFLKSIW